MNFGESSSENVRTTNAVVYTENGDTSTFLSSEWAVKVGVCTSCIILIRIKIINLNLEGATGPFFSHLSMFENVYFTERIPWYFYFLSH